jgi:hypothetical protein
MGMKHPATFQAQDTSLVALIAKVGKTHTMFSYAKGIRFLSWGAIRVNTAYSEGIHPQPWQRGWNLIRKNEHSKGTHQLY